MPAWIHQSLLAAALVSVAVAGCRSERKPPGDEDDDDNPAPASVTGKAAESGVQRNDSTGSTASAPAQTAGAGSVTWSFDTASPGAPPPGFSFGRTGSGRLGKWIVRSAPDAPSGPNVLAQEDDDATDYRFPVAVADSPSFADVRVSARCKPVQGRVDQACGIVWRYLDENNYYLARANALEDNVRFYYVQNGRRHEIKGWNGKVASGVWHELRADMRADHVEVYFNGAKIIDASDSRFRGAGKVGVWTKADSRTLFDNLTATSLRP